jgi:alpha-L-rhamnosidase
MKSILIIFINFLLSAAICQGQQHMKSKESAVEPSMIWSTEVPDGNQAYVAFRKNFNLTDVSSPAFLQLFADSRYLLWINGQYILRGPCRFNPKRPEYDIIDIQPFIKKGNNVIVVLVHNYGSAINGRIMKHVPGLTAALVMSGKEILRTDPTWRYNDHSRYLPSPESWNTVPDVIDGRIDTGEWISADYNDSSWPFARAVDGAQWGQMYPREIPLPEETELTELKLLPSGQLLSTALPVQLTAGQEILVDFGCMAMAYTVMELDADAGSRLTMKYALRYQNGQPAEMYGVGNVYTAAAGHQSFITTDQWGSHYMMVKCESGRVNILGLKMIDRRYPFERIGRFRCSDEMLNDLWNMAVNTIEITSDDGYGSDARERNEWLQDPAQPNFITTRVALAGTGPGGQKVFSDPRLLKNLLRHAAQSQLPDGQIKATFPTDRGPEDCHYIIEDYSCQWIEALRIYYNATGDREFLREMMPVLVAQIKWFLSHLTPRGLLLAREYTSFDNPLAYITCEGATINAFLYQALIDSDYLLLVLGDKEQAADFSKAGEALKSAFNNQFWNEAEGAFNSAFIGDRVYGPTAHAQLIALDRGLVPENRKESVRRWFLTNYKNPGMNHVCSNPDFEKMIDQKAGVNMPVVYYWVFQELYRMNTAQMDLEVIQELRRRWTPMVKFLFNSGTLAESFMNEKGEGSTEACHNYGAVPAYFLSSYILGVRLDGPVWDKKLLIEPRLGDLTFAEGIVVTEFGSVPVSWKKEGDGKSLTFNLTIPDGIIATVHFPKLSDKSTFILNGVICMKNGVPEKNVSIKGRWIVIGNVSGECSGSILVK